MIGKELEIVIHGKAFDHFPSESAGLLIHLLLVRSKIPEPATYDNEDNDKNNKALSRRLNPTICFWIFHLVTESSQTFNYLTISNQDTVFLPTGITAKLILRVYAEIDEITIKMLTTLPQVDRSWTAFPFHSRRFGVEQSIVKPFHDAEFVAGWIIAVKGRVARRWRRRLGRRRGTGNQKQQTDGKGKRFHSPPIALPARFFCPAETDYNDPNFLAKFGRTYCK